MYVARGTYTGTGGAVITITKSITLYGGWAGTTATPPVRDPSLYPTRLDGQDARRVVYVGEGITPTIDGFIIARGNASNGINPGCGGGIYASDASPVSHEQRHHQQRRLHQYHQLGIWRWHLSGVRFCPSPHQRQPHRQQHGQWGMGSGKGGGLY